MKSKIYIEPPQVSKNRIVYQYHIKGDWVEVFKKKQMFYIEYSCDISSVPESVAVIPLLCNILPVSWIYDAEIEVNSCDKDFFNSVKEFKQGYIDMYPKMQFGGKLSVNKVEDNKKNKVGGVVSFFSGGVDAFNTLTIHAEEKPTLITLWGADIAIGDIKGWENVQKQLHQVAEEFQVDYITIKSSLRCFLDEDKLSAMTREDDSGGWWHGFQHGIGLISHAAPITYSMGKSVVYIASSFTIKEKGLIPCASDPTIDNNLRFCESQVVHDGYEFNRQDKIHNITEFSKKCGIKIPLRVCWQSQGGKNCCLCEKCWRTILGIIAEKEDPRKYGFDYSDKEFNHIVKLMKRCSNPMFGELRYEPIQSAMRKNYTLLELQPKLKWFYNIDINRLGYHPLYTFARRYKNRVKRVLKARTDTK